jgi:hypothetical protein
MASGAVSAAVQRVPSAAMDDAGFSARHRARPAFIHQHGGKALAARARAFSQPEASDAAAHDQNIGVMSVTCMCLTGKTGEWYNPLGFTCTRLAQWPTLCENTCITTTPAAISPIPSMAGRSGAADQKRRRDADQRTMPKATQTA